jgi:DNA-binding CsgD family transcriptional regulator
VKTSLPMSEDEGTPFANLTPREWAVFPLVARGMSDDEIASTLNLAGGTTRIHVRQLLQKLNLKGRREVAQVFEQMGKVVGVVKAWQSDRGVLTSPDVPGEVLAWAEVLEGTDRELAPGDQVEFRYGPLPPSSTYPHQALWVRKL